MRYKLRHPIRAIREPFGTAGLIVACVALIAALGGSAIAASNALTGKQKREVKKIAKKYAGQNGQQGPAGSAGPQGPKGDTGTAGANGTNGTNGKDGTNGTTGATGKAGTDGESVNVIKLLDGDTNCPKGGAKIVNDAGDQEAFACNGTSGDGEFPKTLPSGHAMTGFWQVLGDAAVHLDPVGWSVSTIDFPLPLATPPTETLVIKADGSNSLAEKEDCPGSIFDPKATTGVLCLYQGDTASVTLKTNLLQTFGAVLYFEPNDESFGSWAVVAE